LAYFFLIIQKSSKKKNYVSQEVNIILLAYKIDYHKINLRQMMYIVSILTSIVLAFSITFVSYLHENLVIAILLATLIALVSLLIIYTIIGCIYSHKVLKNDKEKSVKKKNKNKKR